MVIQVNGPLCGCGNRGCFEALASRTAMVQRIQAAVQAGETTVLTEMLGNSLAQLRSGDLRKAFRRGDKLVQRIIGEAAHATGVATANLVNVLNPEVVVLGGGVMEALGPEMLPISRQALDDYAMPGAMTGVQVRVSCLGDYAGITGGAVLALQKTQSALKIKPLPKIVVKAALQMNPAAA